MNRRDLLRAVALGAAAVTLDQLMSRLAAAAEAKGRKPNILLILVDDLGYADLSCQGCKDVKTPRIDALAAEGVRFTSGYVSAPLCSPTRAGIMTGRYQQRFGWEFNPDRGDKGIDPAQRTMADYLKAAGYATGIVGKWHLGYAQPYLPLQRGFDEWYGFTYAMNPYAGDGTTQKLFRGNDQVEEKDYFTDVWTREAIDFIERHKDKPFFLYLPYNAPHPPMHTAPRFKDKFAEIADPNRRMFATMLATLDEGIGRVLDKVRELKLDEDTLVIFLSDNGGNPAVNASLNTPLAGGKVDVKEGGIRIPFIIRWTGKVPAGKVDDRPIISLDILPTALAAAGAGIPAVAEGADLTPYLTGRAEAPHDCLYWRMGDGWAVRGGDWKLRCDKKGEAPKLFNLAKDISETTDLSKDQPAKVKELQDAWDRWNAKNIKPVKVPKKSPSPSGRGPG